MQHSLEKILKTISGFDENVSVQQTNYLMGSASVSGAYFSHCRKYRYTLWRIWETDKPLVMFIGLNPSTATDQVDDPTIRRVTRFAKTLGYGGVFMMNCFPFITPDPEKLCLNDFAQNVNDRLLIQLKGICIDTIFAWGNFRAVKEHKRDIELMKMFPGAKALIINQDGSPRHPLYVKADTVPVIYSIKNIE